MKQKGSITAFLALILTLLFSFVLTTLEAARISAAGFYVSMLSSMSGDSFLASYYFPLFEEYGLLGVDAGYGTTALLYSRMEENLKKKVVYAAGSLQDSMLSMTEPKITIKGHETLLSGEGAEFFRQIKQQVAYEGFRIALGELFDAAILRDSASVGEVYRKQEKVQEETANTVAELLKLMTLVDGIATRKQEIKFDSEGKPKTVRTFIKQLSPLSETELREAFGNDPVFDVLQPLFLYPQTAGNTARAYLEAAIKADEALQQLYSSIEICEASGKELAAAKAATEQERKEWERKAKEAKKLLEEGEEDKEKQDEEQCYQEAMQNIERCAAEISFLDEEMDGLEAETEELWREAGTKKQYYQAMLKSAHTSYEKIRETINAVLLLLKEAERTVDILEEKQKAAKASAIAYELFLKEKETTLSSQLYEVFQKELESLKLYLGMAEQGYVPAVMKQSLKENQELLKRLALSEFEEKKLRTMLREVERFTEEIVSYRLEGLWFTYGDVRGGKESGEHIKEALEQLLSTNVCELVGISKEELSNSKISGSELPSASLERQPLYESLSQCISQITSKFSESGMAGICSMLLEATGDALALELYFSEFFSDYQNQKEHTKLAYEREYILFGNESDAGNLTQMILSLVAFRSLFTMTALLQNAEKMAQLSSIAQAAASVVGIPLLSMIIKYSLLLLWATEEAFVETAALLKGKRIPFFLAEGTISVAEIFRFGRGLVTAKAKGIADSVIGTAYSDYLLLFSLLESKTKKCYFAMDLIQENIRLCYRDSFRIRNVVTALSFETDAKLTKTWFPEYFSKAFRIQKRQEVSY